LINWRISAFCSGGAFVLSLLIGLVSGNFFGIALLRALALGVFFGIIGAAGYAAIVRWVPEALTEIATTPVEPPAGEARPDTPSPRIDITLPAEQPEFMAAGTAGEAEDTIDGSFVSFAPQTPREILEAESPKTGDSVTSGALGSYYSGDISDDVDVLPDLESLSDAFVAPEPVSSEEPSFEESPRPKATSPNDGPDPKTLASAIRTMFNKDQEGK
jgi:hypothetical protein